jgi:hypothetical protein
MYLFGLTTYQHSIGHMTPKQERQFWLTSCVTNFKATQGVKTTSHAGVKRYINPCCSNPFCYLWPHREKRWLQFLCLNHKQQKTCPHLNKKKYFSEVFCAYKSMFCACKSELDFECLRLFDIEKGRYVYT